MLSSGFDTLAAVGCTKLDAKTYLKKMFQSSYIQLYTQLLNVLQLSNDSNRTSYISFESTYYI